MPHSVVNLDNQSVVRIISASLVRFGRYGFDGTSMHDIATDAGVSKSLLHYHFDSKEHLFLESQLFLLRSLLEQLRAFNGIVDGGRAQIELVLDQVMNFLEANIDQLAVILTFRSVAQRNPEVRQRLELFHAEVHASTVDAITRVLGAHVERLTVPPPRLANVLLTAFNGLVVQLAFAGTEDASQHVRECFEDIKELLTPVVLQEVS